MDLLNEICEEAEENNHDDTQANLANDKNLENEEAETEKRENKIIDEIMRAL